MEKEVFTLPQFDARDHVELDALLGILLGHRSFPRIITTGPPRGTYEGFARRRQWSRHVGRVFFFFRFVSPSTASPRL